MILLPFSFDKGKLSYSYAHAFWVGKAVSWVVKKEAEIIFKSWLKGVAKQEGKRVAQAAMKSLYTLPNDETFRLAVVAALSGGNYGQAANFATQRSAKLMKEGAGKQWKQDKQNLAEHPEMAAQSFVSSAGNTVEGQLSGVSDAVESRWNTADDVITCGKGNVDIELKQGPRGRKYYAVTESPNDKLLTGRALLQRLLYKSMMRNSSFHSPEKAQQGSKFYSHLACIGGKSRKVTAFIGGIAIQNKAGFTSLKNVQAKSLKFMDKMSHWVDKKL